MHRNTEMRYNNILTCLPLDDKILGVWKVFFCIFKNFLLGTYIILINREKNRVKKKPRWKKKFQSNKSTFLFLSLF